MLDWIYNLFGTILAWFNTITGSYAVALILYALMFKIIFIPFSIKQQKNQILMAKLRPKVAKIEKKYAGRNDNATRQKMQQEILEMQQKEGYSPFSGCLPMLLQLPIIIFLYNVIRAPLSYICKFSADTIKAIADMVGYTAEKIEEIALITKMHEFGLDKITVDGFDPSILPNFTVFGLDLAQTPSIVNISWLVLIPVLTAVFQWLSMFLMRKMQGNSTQMAGADAQAAMSMRMMDLIFPAMTLFIAFSMPALLGVYWIYQSILGLIQQLILVKVMPLPKYTAEDLKEIERAEKERAKAQKTAMQEKPRYKSLHYIDEDDYDTLPELQGKASAPEQKKSGIEQASLKDDSNSKNSKKK